jgi:hypothetical protein
MVVTPTAPRSGVMHAKFEFIECDVIKIKTLSIRGVLAKLSQLLVLYEYMEIASVYPELDPKKGNTGAISFLGGHIVISASAEFHTVILDARVQEGDNNRGSIFLGLLAEFENSVLSPRMVYPKIVNHSRGAHI